MPNWLNDVNKVVTGLLTTSIVALASFVFDANTRIAVLESHAASQNAVANENRENFRKLNESIARLNTVLTVLNDRLARDGKSVAMPSSVVSE
ncbi:TPA: hypothetical protein ACGR4R_003089 [Aeromonas veronii]|jgi:uncharacterized coiled-coil protein SlyX|uniref:Uncharacterized protein n=1 Tax=Aeromonas veronii TaxID=654 RepID=A0AAX2UPJ4_AERVE|nr:MULTISPECIES: hypothetical protein [Aeromonas]MBS4705200.1 hypothetical protein [Aeromonas veronii]MCD6618745.1 hypothetical protein [Aeromonas veronii]MCF5728926.1 hypothetical protein [Aeromonas veronii]MDD9227903.1 hypothetical protein [Aeromonas hydrophila]MDM5056566.1 hypothetical protein [Aeromonas dhakensis]